MEINNQIKTEKVAIIGTPCHLVAADKLDAYSDCLGETSLDLKIGLFCMENFSYTYMKKLLEKYDAEMKDVIECRVEKNYMWFYLTEDRLVKIPLKEAKSCMRKNCQVCMDFTSELSDISVGSVGSPEGWSTVIVRTEKGLKHLKKAEEDNYIVTKPLTDSGMKIIERLARKKKKENKEEIMKREHIGRPVLYRRHIPPDIFEEEVRYCQFEDLKGDVIDVGSCVLCGACVLACPEDIVAIEDRKPQIKGKCPEGCNICYVACPRTYIPEKEPNIDADKKPLGNYLKIVSAQAPMIKGQDGGVATALLNYALTEKIVDEVLVVDKNKDHPWKPEAKVTNNVADVLSASGTKYSACPIFKSLKSFKNSRISESH
ncbi:MAG: Coenzyme F420 hydrogenase/dehydrogenase, beta subunit C-terminal domain [Methanobacterium sp.]|nr:Coenzyme F420 hydrogenase/dehydrogenase, beta subunit C-terminal domain [Methanobacterium sp.]